ncbi:MAG TPA: hypothetical protein VK081_11130 [Planctomycetota bacterium]|nr:hypothetical protein [Planctomycetota bacterium]
MLFAFTLAASSVLAPQDPAGADAPAKIPISVLYAGEAGTPREAAFLEFLRQRFVKVGNVPAAELLASRAEGWDVVVADGSTEMVDNRLRMKGCTKLEFPADWTKPTVLIASSGRAVEKVSKIGWL